MDSAKGPRELRKGKEKFRTMNVKLRIYVFEKNKMALWQLS